MSRPRPLLALALGGLLAGLAAAPAAAWIPPAPRIAQSVAAANVAAHRAIPLSLDVAVLVRSVDVASGVLDTDPNGVARLALRHQSGFEERHLLRAGQHTASRAGVPLADPRPLLPPLYLLQIASPQRWLDEVAALGIDIGRVSLGAEGDHDCYVIGAAEEGPSLWIDQDTLTPVRIDLAGGVHVFLGPNGMGGAAPLPAWVEVEEPGADPLRLEVRAVRPGKNDPQAYAPSWLSH